MRRRSWLAALCAGLMLFTQVAYAAPAPVPATPGTAGEAPPPRETAGGDFSTQSYSPGDRIAETDEEFVADSGSGLDSYTFRDGSPIQFPIRITRYFGPVDGEGHLLHPENVEGETALLTLRVWDVDADYSGGDFAPEVDEVLFNGEQVGILSGSNGQWSTFTVEVPVAQLKFPTYDEASGVQPSENMVTINIDTANVGVCECWAVEVDWGRLVIKGIRPSLLLHGFMSSASTWNPWVDSYAPNIGLPVRARSFANNHASWFAHAGELAGYVAEAKQKFGVEKLNLVGHSKGGLDSRAYLAMGGDDVMNLVMLGTPNAGSPLADYALAGSILNPWVGLVSLIGQPALTELSGTYMALGNQVVGPNPNTRYYTVAGNWKGFLGMSNPLIWGDDDGVVAVSSVRALPYTSSLGSTSHFHTGMTGNIEEFNLAKGQIAEPMSVAEPAAEMSPISTTSLVAYTANPTNSSEILVSAGAPASLGIMWGEGNLDLTLTSPSGSTISGAGAGVEYAVNTDPTLGMQYAAYRILAPEAGIYRLNVTAAGGSVDYLALGTTEGGAKLTAGPADAFTASGSPTVITAQIDWNGQTPVPVTVTAHVSQPDGTVDLVELTGGASGSFSGTHTADMSGMHHVVVVAESQEAAAPFTRIVNTGFSVLSGADQFTGAYSHAGADLNFDGLYDKLSVQADVSIAQSGSYVVTAHLTDAAGATIVRSGTEVSLAAGAGSVTLDFDGFTLGKSGFAGDLLLTDLALVRADGSVADFRSPATTLSGYNSRQFQRPSIAVLPGISDHGVDNNGNGQFDELVVSVPVEVLNAGYYEFNARLMDSQGDEIGWYGSYAYLNAGENVVDLVYSGEAIGQRGLDGPYYVRDFSIYSGSSRGFNEYELHATQPYDVSYFEGFAGTFDGLRTRIAQLHSNGLITNLGIARSLTAKVDSAQKAAAGGNNDTARNILGALTNELAAQSGKHVDPQAAAILEKLIQGLLRRLP